MQLTFNINLKQKAMKKVLLILMIGLLCGAVYAQKTKSDIKKLIPAELRQAIPDNNMVNYAQIKPLLVKYSVVLSILDAEYKVAQSPDSDCGCEEESGLFKFRIYCTGGWVCNPPEDCLQYGCGYYEDCPKDGTCTLTPWPTCDYSYYCPGCSSFMLSENWYIMWCWYDPDEQ